MSCLFSRAARAGLRDYRTMRLAVPVLLAVLAGLMTTAAARADDPPAPAVDRSTFTAFNPTPTADLRGLCTDRPTKSTSPCTVDAGHWQVESDAYDYTLDRTGGISATTQLFASTNIKLGLTDTADIEVNITPYEEVSARDRTTGAVSRAAGFGDIILKAKVNLLGENGGNVAFGLAPFIKIPTAHGSLGNGAVEGGIIAPIQIALPGNASLVIDPELDVLQNASGSGQHANTSGLVSLSWPASKAVTLSAELWADANFDPAGRVTQVSADVGAAWIPAQTPNLQFDGGFNLGLNKVTPGVEAYIGVSHRF